MSDNEDGFDEGLEPIDLGPGDLAIVVRADGENEVYFLLEEDENEQEGVQAEGSGGDEDGELAEPSIKAKFLAEFILFAMSNAQCQEIFAKAKLN